MSKMEVSVFTSDPELADAIKQLDSIPNPIYRDLAQAELIVHIGNLFYAKAYCRKQQWDAAEHKRQVRQQIKDKGQPRAGKGKVN